MQINTTNNLQNIVLKFATLWLKPPHPAIPPPFSTQPGCSNPLQAGNHYRMFQKYIIFTTPEILWVTMKNFEQMMQ